MNRTNTAGLEDDVGGDEAAMDDEDGAEFDDAEEDDEDDEDRPMSCTSGFFTKFWFGEVAGMETCVKIREKLPCSQQR